MFVNLSCFAISAFISAWKNDSLNDTMIAISCNVLRWGIDKLKMACLELNIKCASCIGPLQGQSKCTLYIMMNFKKMYEKAYCLELVK